MESYNTTSHAYSVGTLAFRESTRELSVVQTYAIHVSVIYTHHRCYYGCQDSDVLSLTGCVVCAALFAI